MNELEKSICFNEITYEFLKIRVCSQGAIVKELLEVIVGNNGIYKEEILDSLKYSDTAIRPVLNSLYVAGFIDRQEKGRLHIYSINDNGKRLINEMRRKTL